MLPNHDLPQKVQRLFFVIVAGFIAIAIALFYWSIWQANALLQRDDNPRLVEAELRLARGNIYDRDGVLLAHSIGPGNRLVRAYPIQQVGPLVGYYSFRHGTAGAEAGYDALLRGETSDPLVPLWQGFSHTPQTGSNVRLTLSARWQTATDALLPEQPSALLLLTLPTAEALSWVSHPSYDPNTLDETFDELTAVANAPLLDRVAQGQYPPGLLLQPLIMASALEKGQIRLNEPVNDPDKPVRVINRLIQCATRPPTTATWLDTLQHECPAPMLVLADQLGISGLDQIFTDFQLTQPPLLPFPLEFVPPKPLSDPLLAGIGQENLVVSPLQMALAMAALANGDGRLPTPQIAQAVSDPAGDWLPVAQPTANSPTAVTPATAVLIRQNLPQEGEITEFSTLVLSGPKGSTNAWYVGFAPATSPRYLVVIVIEDAPDTELVQSIGRGLLTAVLAEE